VKITVVGRGHVGGGLADLWRVAGHQVTGVGRDGGDATGARVVVVAVPAAAIVGALAQVTGLGGQVTIDACSLYTARDRLSVAVASDQVGHRRSDRQIALDKLRRRLRPDRQAASESEQPLRRRASGTGDHRVTRSGCRIRPNVRLRTSTLGHACLKTARHSPGHSPGPLGLSSTATRAQANSDDHRPQRTRTNHPYVVA
jgi:hypothetical protein